MLRDLIYANLVVCSPQVYELLIECCAGLFVCRNVYIVLGSCYFDGGLCLGLLLCVMETLVIIVEFPAEVFVSR